MHGRQKHLVFHFCAFASVDLLIATVALLTAALLPAVRHGADPWSILAAIRVRPAHVLLALGACVAWHAVFRSHGLYRSWRMGLLMAEWWEVARATTIGTLLFAGLAVLFDQLAITRSFLVTFWIVTLVGTCALRTTLRIFLGEVRRKGHNLRNVVVIGTGKRACRLGDDLRHREEMGYHLLGYIDERLHNPDALPLLGTLDEAASVLSRLPVDEVLVALPMKSFYETIAALVTVCEDLGITVRIPADFFHLRLAAASMDRLDHNPILTLQPPSPSPRGLLLKRVVDFACSAAALAALLPLFAVIAIAIKLDSSGPVLFAQERVGIGRRRFRMFKFRSMVVDAEARMAALEQYNEASGAAFKIRNDPRVTRVGRFIRRYSLDELPQFWNVFVGDMSLVGPRPMSLRDAEALQSQWQKRRFSIKPGLTCLWQATGGRHAVDFDEWMKLDLHYIDNWSIRLDLELMLKTLPAMIRGTGY